jgi:hypothetical protein
MTGAEGWGPLILHDGKSCPVVGKQVLVYTASGQSAQGLIYPAAALPPCSLWIWDSLCPDHWPMRVTCYRIKAEPSGSAALLRAVAANPQTKVHAPDGEFERNHPKRKVRT